MQDVARDAISEYVNTHTHRERVDRVIDRGLAEDAEMLRRLADQ